MFTQIDEMIAIHRRPAVRRLLEAAAANRARLALALAAMPAIAVIAFAVVAAVRDGGAGSPVSCDKPLCIDVIGPATDEVEPMAPVRIRLQGDVDHDTALHALLLTNDPAGDRRFDGDVLTFHPQWPGFAKGVTYTVSLDLPQEEVPHGAAPVSLRYQFTTTGKLKISSVFPIDGAKEIGLDGPIMVQFNRAVAPLTVVDAKSAQNVIEFTPPIEGEGHWLNTSLYTFRPKPGWAPATTYSARIKAGLMNDLGATLDDDYVFGFSTLSPAVSTFAPPDKSTFVDPQPDIRVVFNQPVDRATAEQRFTLEPAGGAPVAGTFEWSDDVTMIFHPSVRLALGTHFSATQHIGTKSRDVAATIPFDQIWTFETVGVPRVASTTPANGEQHAARYGFSITFTNPMDQKSVEDHITFSPEPEGGLNFYWDGSGRTISAGVALAASSPYSFSLTTDAKDRYGQPLAEPLSVSFTTDRVQPGYGLFRSSRSGTFNAYLDPTVIATSWNLGQLDFELYRIDRAGFIKYERSDPGQPAGFLIRKWTETIANPVPDRQTTTSTRLSPDAPLEQGFYYLTLTAPGVTGSDLMPFVVSSANITTKITNRDLLVWAVDMKSGAPLAGLPLDVLNSANSSVATGTTGDDGVARIDVRAPANGNYYDGYYVSAERSDVTALAGTMWSSGFSSSSPDISIQFQTSPYVGNMFTDRPIYRPGETVHLKGIVRADDDAHYSVPAAGSSFALNLNDPSGKQLYAAPASLSDMGTFEATIALSADAPVGTYYGQLVDTAPSSTPQYLSQFATIQFRVAEFRKPEFELTAKPGQASYVNGDTVVADVNASLFFGAPLPNADVSWQVTSQQYNFSDPAYERYSFGDYDETRYYRDGPYYEQQQRMRGQGSGKTDAAGNFSFSVPGDVSADPMSQVFTLEATVTDQNGQQVTASTAVPVHKGDFYIGMHATDYVASAGTKSDFDLVTLDTDGKPAPNVPMTVSVYERTWRTVRERDTDGQQRYKSEYDDKLVDTFGASTGADGKGAFSFIPKKSGEYRIVASAKDGRGNAIKSATYIWASGGEYATWRIGNDDIVQLIADKDEYAPGDTAKILVAAPFGGSTALVTQERGRLMRYDIRPLAGNSEIIEVPITDDHIPNVYISVALFKPPAAANPMPQAKFGTVNLKVSTDRKKLNIAIKPDRERYGPRDNVTYQITTTDSDGHGVPAELTLALVDKSVLSLQDDFSRSSLDAFWSKRYLGVFTGSTFSISIDRANELNVDRLKQGGKGGGGGAPDETRTFFPNTAYWNAALRTDAHGNATVQVPLPDTLTTWRLTARGVTADTRVGDTHEDIVTSKDVIVRPAVPRFLVADDHAFLGAIVHNFSGKAQDFDVSLDATGVTVDGSPSQRVHINNGEDSVVRWSTHAQLGVDKATFALEAKAGDASDRLKLDLPVFAFVTPETAGTAGELGADGPASEAIEVPYYVRPDAGELTVKLSPSLASGMNTSLEYLDEYPYDNAETIVSRFLPRLALDRAIKELNLTDVNGGGTDVDALVQRSLQKLYTAQTSQGGWGWWQGDDPDPAITAYVLIGLAEAKRSGYAVDDTVESNAAAYLRTQLDSDRDVVSPQFDLRAYMLYALARDGRGDLGRSYAIAERQAELSNTSKAWIAVAIKLSGGADDDPRVTTLLSALQAAAIPSATGNHWEEAKYDSATFSNSTQATGQVLEALTMFSPDNPLIDGTLRWLMVSRKDGGNWESTHDTAVVLLAITDFMLARKDAQETFGYSVDLNGAQRLQGQAVAGKVNQEDTLVVQMKDLLKDTANTLTIDRTSASTGRLYYTAHLHYYTPAQNVEAADHGIGVSHEYFAADGNADVPVTEVALGHAVKVKVTLVAESDLNYLVLEDYLPAGLEPIDTTLKTTSPEFQRRMYEEQAKSYNVGRRYSPFSHIDVHDNRVAMFARFVPKGVYEYTYFAQATTPGEFKLAPATAYEQYFPEVWGRSDGGAFTVTASAATVTSATPSRIALTFAAYDQPSPSDPVITSGDLPLRPRARRVARIRARRFCADARLLYAGRRQPGSLLVRSRDVAWQFVLRRDQQHRSDARFHDVVRGLTEQRPSDAMPALRRHHDDVDSASLRALDDSLRWVVR